MGTKHVIDGVEVELDAGVSPSELDQSDDERPEDLDLAAIEAEVAAEDDEIGGLGR